MFRSQYSKFRAIYGLRLNYTIVKNEDGIMVCAKRIKKAHWFKPLPKPETKAPLKRTISEDKTATHDASFIEEDMLNKSFITAHDDNAAVQSHADDFSRASSPREDPHNAFGDSLERSEPFSLTA